MCTQCRTSPRPQHARSWNRAHVYSFCSCSSDFTDFPCLSSHCYYQTISKPKGHQQTRLLDFFARNYFSSFFLTLNKHAHFPTFPSPNSLASFPLHKQCQETRSVKNQAAFLNNCVTAWNGTCESLTTSSVHRAFPEKGNKTSLGGILQVPALRQGSPMGVQPINGWHLNSSGICCVKTRGYHTMVELEGC